MKKLLQLLNEYEMVIWTDRVWWWAIDDGTFFCTRTSKKGNLIVQYSSEDEAILRIISKKFWFVKWLITNNKVNRVKEVINDIQYRGHGQIENVDCYNQYDSLLMLLAIQDNPINFLTSVLK